MSEEARILEVLRERVEQARFRHEQAKAAFWSIAADPRQLPRVPTGRLQPDGSDRIREAFREETEAREELLDAVHRFSDYLLAHMHAVEAAVVDCHHA
ncbi:MAG TPA: hypothetical protein VG297_21915 [Bryobacteraceae bacterium]|jgi:hypothetical protein|nr:hypothetical protein [Bryobacteraceae bacterium]